MGLPASTDMPSALLTCACVINAQATASAARDSAAYESSRPAVIGTARIIRRMFILRLFQKLRRLDRVLEFRERPYTAMTADIGLDVELQRFDRVVQLLRGGVAGAAGRGEPQIALK